MALFSYAKVLFVVALEVSSPTSVTARSMREGTTNSHASGAASAASTLVPGMTATNHAEGIEERVVEKPLLDEISRTITGLLLEPGTIFECQRFHDWFSRWKFYYLDDLDDIKKAIYLAVISFYRNDHLPLTLAAAKNDGTRHIADIWLGILIDQWDAQGKTEEEVFELLELDKFDGRIGDNPLFETWKVFVHQILSESDAELVIADVISDPRYS